VQNTQQVSWIPSTIVLLLLLLHLFNSLFSRTTCVSWYQKGKTSLDLNEAKDGGVLWWKWRQLDHMQTICTSLQTDNHTNTSLLSFYRLDALPGIQPTVSKHWRQKFIQNCTKSLTITIYPNAHQFIPLSGNSLGQGVYTCASVNKLLTFTPEAVGFRNNVEKRGGSKACVDVWN